jgi:hypothetical protein
MQIHAQADRNKLKSDMSTRVAETMASLHETQRVDLRYAGISDDGATTLANGLRENTSVTNIDFSYNDIDDEGAVALADALKFNTSVTTIDIARNKRLRHLFLFDAWRMLLSLMCADKCGVVWLFFLENGGKDGIAAPDNIETLRAEFAVVVEERRRRRSYSRCCTM